MLVFIGIYLLVTYSISLLSGGIFKEFYKELNEFARKDESGELKEDMEAWGKEIRKAIAMMLIMTFHAVVVLVMLFIFLIKAIYIDALVFPTVLIMSYLVGNIILIITNKKYREKRKKKDATVTTFRGQLFRATIVVYVLYILTQLLWG